MNAEMEQVKTHHRYDLEQFRKCQDELNAARKRIEKLESLARSVKDWFHNHKAPMQDLEAAMARTLAALDEKDEK